MNVTVAAWILVVGLWDANGTVAIPQANQQTCERAAEVVKAHRASAVCVPQTQYQPETK